jgi:regulator of protease activity HflC (stomatin/prohibitin superfamily)
MNPALVTATLLVALCVAVVVSTVRLVPTGSYALVLRWGRVARESGPGVVAVVPGVDRLVVLSAQPSRLEPVPVVATTRDGVDVRMELSVRWRVVDPARSLLAVPDAATATADAVEHAARHVVNETPLRALVEERSDVLAGLDERASAVTAEWGAAVLDVDALEVELRAGPELLRLLQ